MYIFSLAMTERKIIMKYLLSEKNALKVLHILLPILLALFSFCVLTTVVPETQFMKSSVESLEKSRDTVITFAGASTAVALAVSALPDDFGTPLAQNFQDLNKYFIIILVFIILEKIIVIEGSKIAFALIIPLACGIYILGILANKNRVKKVSYKIMILGIAVVLLIPCSTGITNLLCKDYIEYVDETIESAENGAENVNAAIYKADEEMSIFDKLSEAFKTAIDGVKDLVNHFNELIKRCLKSVAILIISDIVIPLLVMLCFIWLIKYLFGGKVSIPELEDFLDKIYSINKKSDKS